MNKFKKKESILKRFIIKEKDCYAENIIEIFTENDIHIIEK